MKVLFLSIIIFLIFLWIMLSTDYGKQFGETILKTLDNIFGDSDEKSHDIKNEDDPCKTCDCFDCQQDCPKYIEYLHKKKILK